MRITSTISLSWVATTTVVPMRLMRCRSYTSVGIMQLLHRINRMGTTVLVATHDKEMVDAMRKRVVALEEGRVVRDKVKGAYADEV